MLSILHYFHIGLQLFLGEVSFLARHCEDKIMPTEYMRKIYLDGLPERIQKEILRDRMEVRDETICGLEPRRWAQVALMFAGEPGQDVLYCLSRGLNTDATATYLGVNERTIRNASPTAF